MRKAGVLLFSAILGVASALGTGCGGGAATTTSGQSGGNNPPPGNNPTASTLAVNNTSLAFGNVAVGSNKTLPLILTNSGSSSAGIQVTQVNVSGNGFNVTGATLPATLAAGQSMTVNVNFAPSAGGAASGGVSIASNAVDPVVAVALAGAGLAAGQITVSPSSINFGSVNVGSSQSQSGALTAGSASVTVTSASWNGAGFSLGGISFPVAIPAGQSVSFTVTFDPQAAGSVSGGVSFLSNATNSPTSEQLAGTGVQPTQHSVSLSWNPDSSTVQGYYVYRGGQTGGPYTKISTLQAGTSYTDATVASGQSYYYVVTALGTNNVESGYSNQVSAAIP